ncbi:MAG TPA: glycosyltransferase family 4 protein [Burkholderiales bacterium]|nr:glycosyltransferase family 4 protein [Burkholderiales bacterium]
MTETRARLIMLGTAFETRGGISAVVNTYRAHGLFERWPVEYIETHCDGSGWRKLATAARAVRRLVASLARDPNAIVHIHGASRASFWRKSVFMAIALAARCPVIFHLHGGGFATFYEEECGPVRRRIVRFLLERAARIIVLSAQWRAWLASAMHNPNVVCIANPMPMHPEPAAARRRNTLLFLGRLERAKGVFDLVDAVAALRDTHPDARLVLAGDDVDGLAAYAAGRGVADCVQLTGWVGPERKRALLDAAAAFVLPSYAEGLPISLLEAMAAGLPSVASEVGGIPDIIADGVNGMLVAPGDVAMLTRVLRKLLDDRMLRARLGAAARETVRLRFDADHVIGELEKIYASLGLARTGKGRVRRTARALREAA